MTLSKSTIRLFLLRRSLVVARTTPPEELAAMRQLFESLDTDHSGTISYAKLHKGLDEKCHVRYCCYTASVLLHCCIYGRARSSWPRTGR